MNFVEDQIKNNPSTEEEIKKAKIKLLAETAWIYALRGETLKIDDYLLNVHIVWERFNPMDNLLKRVGLSS